MTKDFFEKLAEQEIPSVPENMEREIHTHLNHSMTVGIAVEFVVRVIPFTCLFFTRSILALLIYTMGGSDSLEDSSEQTSELD